MFAWLGSGKLATLYGKHITGYRMMYTGLPYCTSVKPKELALYAYGEWKWPMGLGSRPLAMQINTLG